MKTIPITNELLKNYKIDYSYGNESVRYYNDYEMLKIINDKELKDGRGQIIEGLSEFNHRNLVPPQYGITDKKQIIGYSMEYLKDYVHLAEYLDNGASFEERKELMLELSKTFDYFDTKNFAYLDIHGYNIMYKDGEIKLIDLDGGVLEPYKKKNLEYNVAIRIAKKDLAEYIFETTLGIDRDKIIDLRKISNRKYYLNFYNSLPHRFREFYDYTIDSSLRIFYGITPGLQDLTRTMYEDFNEVMEKKLSKH